MNMEALRRLSAQRQPTERDVLEFGNRLKSEHYIESVSEGLEMIMKCITVTDDQKAGDSNFNIGLFDNPVLKMNLIDESICSILYYIFIAGKDADMPTRGFYRRLIEDEYLPKIRKIAVDARENLATNRVVITQLYNMLAAVAHAAFPSNETIDEEFDVNHMANNYYCLMFFICNTVTPRTRYFDELSKFYMNRVRQ